jgi:hypothetical protein
MEEPLDLQPDAGSDPDKKTLKVLYIDDDRQVVDFMQSIFAPVAIEQFAQWRPGFLSEQEIALLKQVELVAVHHDPSFIDLCQDQGAPGTNNGRNDPNNLTPMSREIRKIYDGDYDAVITDMRMPTNSADNTECYDGAGGLLMANVARLAGVPLLVHSYSWGDSIRRHIAEASPFGAPSERHREFSNAVITPSKKDQTDIFKLLAGALEKRHAQGITAP